MKNKNKSAGKRVTFELFKCHNVAIYFLRMVIYVLNFKKTMKHIVHKLKKQGKFHYL